MDPRLSTLERAITSDESLEAFQTLVLLKKEVIAALLDEYDYSKRECDAIAAFNGLNQDIDADGNSSQKSSGRSTGSLTSSSRQPYNGNPLESSNKGHVLITWQSAEFKKLEMRWRSQLERSIECITAQLERERKNSVSMAEVDSIYESISQLQNTYFQVVEERENTNKLWLRLKMYSAARKDSLGKICKPYGIVTNKPAVGGMETVGKHDLQQLKTLRTFGMAHEPGLKSSGAASDYSTYAQVSLPETLDRTSSPVPDEICGLTKKNSNGSTIADFINQMKSTSQFYAASRNIYIQYSDGSMSYKVFNNIIDFLLQSLGIPSVDRGAVRRILKIHGVGVGSTIDFNTFIIVYWEIAHIIRKAVDVLQCVNIAGIHAQNQALRQHEEDTFVDIEDILVFKKKLVSGDSCTKYLAMEVATGEMRVVDVITKGLDMPTFEQISMEVSRLSKMQTRHLALYLATYHDLNTIYVVSEYCEYGSLLTHMQIKRETIYTMGFIHLVMTQIIEAILYIHCNNMVHGSLSIDKVMIPDTEYNNVKIRDLGMKGLLDTTVQGSALTTMHTAPEGIDGRLCHKSDIWSAGVILAFLVTGIIPEEYMEYAEYKRAVETTLAAGRIFPRDDELIDMLRKMINMDATARPTAFEIITHPWYTRPMHVEDTPGRFNLIVQPMNRLMRYKRLHGDIIRVLEAQEMLFVSHIRKLRDTIEILKRLRGDKLLVKDFTRMLEVEGLSTQIINNILMVVAFNDDEIRTQDFLNALSRWKSGEIALMWNKFKNMVQNEAFSMRKMDFAAFLSDAQSQLMPRGEISRLCNALSVAEQVHWADFARYFE
ncbi:protein kinase domain containing protein [Babesia divergens]|uniref:Protein kinase domain containing protein n=1 Tax=Babesia divergens TaxID=32595 RepID=A0AAD9G8Y7_BABDI|nr:protein kinase domain containing protein [Babesia divergens]